MHETDGPKPPSLSMPAQSYCLEEPVHQEDMVHATLHLPETIYLPVKTAKDAMPCHSGPVEHQSANMSDPPEGEMTAHLDEDEEGNGTLMITW
jgi:hypothetical protein